MKKSEIIDSIVELMQDKTAVARALAGRWTNVVLDDLASRGLLESLQREERTLLRVAGRDYDLAADTDHVFKAFVPAWGYPDGILSKKKSDDFLKQMLSDGTTAEGRPWCYTIFANRTLRLHPLPSTDWAPSVPTNDQKLHIWKYKDIEHLSEASDITEIKTKHTPVLMMGAYAFGCRFDSFADYPTTKLEYEAAVANLFFDQANDLDCPNQVPYRDL